MPLPARSTTTRSRWLVAALIAAATAIAVVGWRLAATAGAAGGAVAAPPPPVVAPVVAPVQKAAARAASPADGQMPFTGFRNAVVRFASVDEGRAALGADDDWIRATSAAQRASLMGVRDPAAASPAAFRAFQAASVQPWPAGQRQRMQRALEEVAPHFNRLGITLPPEVLLVSTDGRESAGTPHTRGRAVVFPMRFDQQSFGDAELMAHELWHIVSRHDPALRTRLYATLGYVPAAPLEWPAAWLPWRLANQDAPHHEHLMWVQLDGRPVALMPVVVADPAELRAPGGSIVTAAQTRLLEVLPGQGSQRTRAVMRQGEPVWHDPEALPAYLEKLGGNSDYLVHPEETLADNIMFLVSGRPVPNRGLLQRIEAAIASR